eukprot:1988773-Rhodomonas_salina.2
MHTPPLRAFFPLSLSASLAPASCPWLVDLALAPAEAPCEGLMGFARGLAKALCPCTTGLGRRESPAETFLPDFVVEAKAAELALVARGASASALRKVAASPTSRSSSDGDITPLSLRRRFAPAPPSPPCAPSTLPSPAAPRNAPPFAPAVDDPIAAASVEPSDGRASALLSALGSTVLGRAAAPPASATTPFGSRCPSAASFLDGVALRLLLGFTSAPASPPSACPFPLFEPFAPS